jgi:hypothetical protein
MNDERMISFVQWGNQIIEHRSMRSSIQLNYILAGSGGLAFLACVYHLFKHGLERPDAFASSWLLNIPVALAVLSVSCFASLFAKPAVKLVLVGLFVLGATGVFAADAFFASEGMASSGAPIWNFDGFSPATRKEVANLARSFGVEADVRGRSEKVQELRSRGLDAVPASWLASFQTAGGALKVDGDEGGLIPLGGVSNTATVLCNETGEFVTYTSDAHGFRNPPGIWTSSRIDLAALGQSLTQGYCVPDGAGFVDLLRPRYSLTLNLGMSGQSSLLQLAAIKEYLHALRPKTVLWFFTEGIDLPDLYDESTHPVVRRYLEPTFSQKLIDRQPQIDGAIQRFQSRQRANLPPPQATGLYALAGRSFDALKLWHLRYKLDLKFGSNGIDTRAWSTLDLFAETLRQARTITNAWGGTLYFVYLPSWTRYRNGANVPEREHAAVLQVVQALQIPVIDVEPAFSAQVDPLLLFPFRRFGHYNETGNRIVAATVLKSLSPRVGSGDDSADDHVTKSIH